jgi:hypothetical protein
MTNAMYMKKHEMKMNKSERSYTNQLKSADGVYAFCAPSAVSGPTQGRSVGQFMSCSVIETAE